nr:CaiB/BaiF CoA-transferase family protein [uncultured Cellulosilyticum sp.]
MPLGAIKIIDFTRLLPGPYCTEILADFGAEVIKIEEPQKGDYSREYGTKVGGNGAMFASINQNKKSVCIDLQTEQGKSQIMALIQEADVLVESFRPRVMQKLGLDYETVKTVNPNIIYCSISGYGQYGPYAQKAGHDINFLSYTGILDLMCKGKQVIDYEMLIPPVQITDISASLNSVIAILIALINRQKTGEGQYIDISIMDSVIASSMQCVLPEYYASRKMPNGDNNQLFGKCANYGVYRTKDNRLLTVAAIEPKFWRAFCNAIQKEELITCIEDTQKLITCREEVQSIIQTKTLKEWENIFSEVDACVTPVIRIDELETNQHVKVRKLLSYEEENIKLESPFKFSTIHMHARSKAPMLGEHSKEILAKYHLVGVKDI